MRLSLDVPSQIFNVYQRSRFVCECVGGWGLGGGGLNGNLKLLRLSLNVPPPIR